MLDPDRRKEYENEIRDLERSRAIDLSRSIHTLKCIGRNLRSQFRLLGFARLVLGQYLRGSIMQGLLSLKLWGLLK